MAKLKYMKKTLTYLHYGNNPNYKMNQNSRGISLTASIRRKILSQYRHF